VADRADAAAFERAVTGAQTRWDLVVDTIGFAPADARQDIAVLTPLANHLVFVSTDFVYDPKQRRFPQREEDGHYVTEGYGGQKRGCELELIAAGTALPWTVVRPCHIYGPGSRLGCLPLHGRDPDLPARLLAGVPIRLVGGGHFLQQPIFVDDLAATILEIGGNPATHGQIFNIAGPEIVESRAYYRIIADILDVAITIEEVPIDAYAREHPEAAPFLCHRIYDLRKLGEAGISLPQIGMEAGLRAHVASLGSI